MDVIDWERVPAYVPPGPAARRYDATHGLHDCLSLLQPHPGQTAMELDFVWNIQNRPDFGEVKDHLAHVPLGSTDRNLYLLQMLAKGGLPRLLRPADLGPVRYPLVDVLTGARVEDLYHYAFQLGGQAIFFSVGMLLPGGLAIPDMLVHNGSWTARVRASDGR